MSFLGSDTFPALNFSTPTPNRHGAFNVATSFSSPMEESYPLSLVDSLSDSPQLPSTFRILHTATHDFLMQAGNAAYNSLLLRNNSLEAEAQAMRSAYAQLMAQLSSRSASSSPPTKLARKDYRREDYPRVTIWTAQDWHMHPKNKKNDEAGIHQARATQTSKKLDAPRASMFYIQKEDGSSVTEIEAGQICTQARLIWEALHTRGIAPDRWGRVSIEAADYYFEQMYKFRDYLRLGEGDWKAQRLAIDTYPGWARGRGLLKGRVKIEVKEESVGGESLVGESPQRKTKKRKEPPTSTSTPKPEKATKLPQTTPTPASPPTVTTAGTATAVANVDTPSDTTTLADPMAVAVSNADTASDTTTLENPMAVTQPEVGPTAPIPTMTPIAPVITSMVSSSPTPITPAVPVPSTPVTVALPISPLTVTSPLTEVDDVVMIPVSPGIPPTVQLSMPTSVTSITPLTLTSPLTPVNAHVTVVDGAPVVTTTLAMTARVPDNRASDVCSPVPPSPIITRVTSITPPSPIQDVPNDSSPPPVVDLTQATNARPLKIKLKLINPLLKSKSTVPVRGESAVSVSNESVVKKLPLTSPIPLSDPTPGAQPLSSNVVNITQAAAVGPWFRFQPNSNSEINLFGRHFCKDVSHKVSRKEVTDAFNKLSAEEKKIWTDKRQENLTAKKESRKQSSGL